MDNVTIHVLLLNSHVAPMLSVEYQNIVQYACVQMATKVNQVRYANSMSASEMMTVNRISTVVKIKCAGILVWRLEHVVAKHSAELSTDMLSVHAHQAIMATHCSNVNKVSYILHKIWWLNICFGSVTKVRNYLTLP